MQVCLNSGGWSVMGGGGGGVLSYSYRTWSSVAEHYHHLHNIVIGFTCHQFIIIDVHMMLYIFGCVCVAAWFLHLGTTDSADQKSIEHRKLQAVLDVPNFWLWGKTHGLPWMLHQDMAMPNLKFRGHPTSCFLAKENGTLSYVRSNAKETWSPPITIFCSQQRSWTSSHQQRRIRHNLASRLHFQSTQCQTSKCVCHNHSLRWQSPTPPHPAYRITILMQVQAQNHITM